MTDYITDENLAAYLQVESVNADLVIELTNGLITELIDEIAAANGVALAPVPSRIKAIALEVAARGYRNPQAYTSVTVGIDDYDKTVRREGKQAERFGVYLTDEETDELLSLAGVAKQRVGSIRLSVPGGC